ncbi:MAG: class I SAM-dependent RNA methyltransferase [Clostridia bacterium]|nr:class I SAM-dependent RNA methyltransferase [Clostridia bacterium]
MFTIQIPATYGAEAVVKRELDRLGYIGSRAINGRVVFNGDYDAIARTNMFLRSGERVLMVLAQFNAQTFNQVYDNVYNINWSDYLTVDCRILTYAKSVNSQLFAIKSLCSIVKKAIVDKLTAQYHSALNESGARAMIEISINNDYATLTLDTSGDGLYKRGYRTLAYSAPLKETLAASLIDLSFYHPDKHFADVFCGSGTLPIEVALRALNIASGLNRQFDYCNFKFIDKQYYNNALTEAKDRQNLDRKVCISGYDISQQAISISRYHAKNAGVDKYIHFQVADARSFSSHNSYGVLISNPPYGQRLGNMAEVKRLYADFGTMYRSLPNWNCYVLTSYEEFERQFGRKADKKRKLYNGNIACTYYTYQSDKPAHKGQ